MRKIFPCTIRAGVSLCALIALESFNILTAQVADPDQIEPSPQSVLQQTNTLPGGDGASSALSFSNFNLGTDDLGVFQNSVNLFTGEVALPVSIAVLPSVRGLSASVSANYSSANSSYLTETWNLEAPTGILGMGWSLDFPKIVVDNKQTGTREDDEYYLVEGGSTNQLVRTRGSATIKEYEVVNYQFWKIKYYTASEKWEITKEDGSQFIYGDQNSGRNTVQWIVKWGNWIGSSSQVSGQQQQAAIWNLSEIRNIYGDAIQYKYSNVEQYVGSAAGKKYTEASYLSEVIDPLGRKIIFSYGNKTAAEYQDPHTEKSEPDAYQERYEKLYLKEVQVKDSENKVIGSVNYDFEIKGVGDLSKRYLTAIHKKFDETLNKNITTSYSYLGAGERMGALQTITTPDGAVISYSYAYESLAKTVKQKIITAPTGYSDPNIWQGPDYVVIGWRQLGSNGSQTSAKRSVKIYAYRWEGEWKEALLTTISNVEHSEYDYWKDFQIILEQDQFSILNYLHSSNSYKLSLFRKNESQPGKWYSHSYTVNTGNGKPSLLSGKQFVAIGNKHDGIINTYTWNGNGWNTAALTQGSGTFFYTATNNYILTHDEDAHPDKLRFYYLNESKNWITKAVPAQYYFSSGGESYWYSANSFAFVMADDNNELIYRWDENYNINKRDDVLGGYHDLAPVFIQENSGIAIAQRGDQRVKLARFDGASWITKPDFIPYENSSSGTYSAFYGDFVVWPTDGSSTWNSGKWTTFDPNSRQWKDATIPGASGEMAGAGMNLSFFKDSYYARNTGGLWSKIYTIPEYTNFPYWQMGATFGVNETNGMLKVMQVKNGKALPIWSLSGGVSVFTYNSDTRREYDQLLGNNVIVAYINNKALNLYKIFDKNNLSATARHYPVTQIKISDGYENNYISFDFHGATATMTPAGGVAQYNKVTVVPGSSSISARPFGYSENYFFNGLTADEVGNTFPGNAATFSQKKLTGLPYRSINYNASGTEVSRSENTWSVYSKDLKNASNFTIEKGYYVRSVATKQKIDDVETISNSSYSSVTGQLTNTSTTYRDAKGSIKTANNVNKYYWEVYDTDRSENRLTEIIQTKSTVNGVATDVRANTYKTFTGLNINLPHRSFIWRGTGTSDYTAWSSTATPSSDWIKASEIISRSSKGTVNETLDKDGFYNTTVWNNDETLALASIFNARATEVLTEDFTSQVNDWYKNGSAWINTSEGILKWNSGTAEGMISPKQAINGSDFVADFEMRIPKHTPSNSSDWIAFNFNKNNYTDRHNVSGYMLYIRYNGNIDLYNTTDKVLATSTLKGSPHDWHQYRIVRKGANIKVFVNGELFFDVNNTRFNGTFVGFTTTKLKGEFDNLRIYPSDAYASASSYDKDYQYVKATFSEEGQKTTYLYDNLHRPIATINGKGIPLSTNAGSRSIDRNATFSNTDPNIVMETLVRGKAGFYDDFSSDLGKWQLIERPNSANSGWLISGGKLIHSNSGNATDYATDGYLYDFGKELIGRVAIEVNVKTPASATSSAVNFGIGMGGDAWQGDNSSSDNSENAIWASFLGNTVWRAYDTSWKNISPNLEPNKTYRLKIVADTENQKADFYIDGKLLLSDLTFRHSTSGIQKIALFNYGHGASTTWEVDNVVLYTDPIHTVSYSDASGKIRQVQSEEPEGQIMVSEPIYDALGRGTVQTKPTRIAARFGYRPGFVSSYNTSNGYLYGEVKDNNPADSYYPYSRTVYDNSPLGRPMASGAPGTLFRYGSGHTPSVTYLNNSSSALPEGFTEGYPANSYFVTKSVDADGGESYKLTDKAGNLIKTAVGPVKGNKPDFSWSNSPAIQKGGSWQFKAAIDHTATYHFKMLKRDDEGAIELRIGTKPGGFNIKKTQTMGSGTFEATKGTTYYVTAYQYPPPRPIPDPDPDPKPCPRPPCQIELPEVINNDAAPPGLVINYATANIIIPNADIYLTTSYEYDDAGNLTKKYPPNYHNPPSLSVNRDSYVSSMTYDHFGRLKSETTPDAGTSKFIYDKQGKVRFTQDGKGTSEGYILYLKYDNFGKVLEEGFYNFTWNEATLQSNAENAAWPPTPPTWRKKYIYGDQVGHKVFRDRLIKVEINNDDVADAEVIENLTYDFEGNIVEKGLEIIDEAEQMPSVKYAYNNLGGVTGLSYGENLTSIKYTYDLSGRLQALGTEEDPSRFASYSYDKNGALYHEKLDREQLTRTFTYNSPGWLTRIDDDLFQQNISYTSNGYGGAGYYTGQIAKTDYTIKWGGPSSNHAYSYRYDKTGKLEIADNSVFSDHDWGVSNIAKYDANGNLQSVQDGATSKNYTYQSGKNKVSSLSGVKPGTYNYDANGNMTNNTGNGFGEIVYDKYSNLPSSMKTLGGETVKFSYGASGQRVAMMKPAGNTPAFKNYYVHGLNAYPLIELNGEQTIFHVYGPTGLLASKEAGGLWNFMLKDHLGSVRVVFGSNSSDRITATLEDESKHHEMADFDQSYPGGTIISSSLYNHTPEPEAAKSLRLNGTANEIIGLAKSLKVNPGDTIRMEVFAKYLKPSKEAGPSKAKLAMASSFLNAFGIVNSIEKRELYNLFKGIYSAGPIFVGNDEADVPKAYLNYLLFDNDHYLEDAGYQAISKAALEDGKNGQHERLALETVVQKPGYIYIYLSNESEVVSEVFFDDLDITTTSSPIIQVNHYEPFGGLISSLHYQKEDSYLNRYRYQSKQLQSEFGADLYDFHARQYDASLGRFLGMDPKGQFASPYVGMGNNPVIGVDPDGEWVNFVIGAIVGGVGGYSTGKSLGKSGWELFGYTMAGAGIGAATAGIGASMTASSSAALGSTGGALAGGAAAGTFNGAAMAGLGGGNMMQGAMYGAIGGVAGSTAGLANINGVIPGAAYGAATGGLISGGMSSLSGGNFGDGFSSGAMSGGIFGGIQGGIMAAESVYERSILFGGVTKSGKQHFVNDLALALNSRNKGVQSISLRDMVNNGETRALVNGQEVNLDVAYANGAGTNSNIYLKYKGRSLRAIESTFRHELIHADDLFSGYASKFYNSTNQHLHQTRLHLELRGYNANLQFGYRKSYYRNQIQNIQNIYDMLYGK